jgi:hypothetical protein
MYYYKVGYHSYEESEYITFTNTVRYTEEQMHKIVGKVAAYVIKKDKYIKKREECQINDIVQSEHFIIGMEKEGFKQLPFDVVSSYWGWNGFTIKKRPKFYAPHIWEHDSDDKDRALISVMKEALKREKASKKKSK